MFWYHYFFIASRILSPINRGLAFFLVIYENKELPVNFTNYTSKFTMKSWFLLQLHGELLADSPDLVHDLQDLSDTETASWRNVQDLFNQTLCLVNYLRTATL